MNFINAIFDFLDERRIVRRIAFFVTLWLTVTTVYWTLGFAETSNRPGLDVAAIIAAVWAPLGVLQGAIFKFYDEGRRG